AAAPARDEPRVMMVGGQPVAGQLPWVASLSTQHGFRCGATLVAPGFVLTGASCLGDPPSADGTASPPAPGPAETYTVRVDSLDRTRGGHVRAVRRVVVHPRFNWARPDPIGNPRGYVADIAVLQLDRPVPEPPARL